MEESPEDDREPLVAGDSDIQISNDFQSVHHVAGLSLFATIVFLSGEMAGSGMLALPGALANSGWSGILLIALGCSVAGFNGVHLGHCWIMLLERYPEYRTHVKAPYPSIAEKAYGKWMRIIIRVSIDITLFGATLVYTILISQSLHSLVSQIGFSVNFCVWLVVTTVVLTPLTWFGSPKDFKWVAIIALVSVAGAAVLITISNIMHLSKTDTGIDSNTHPKITIKSFSLAFGAILFAFGGASTFPTIQHDMREPALFKYGVVAAFAILLCLYIPVAITGFVAYGTDVNANILQSLPDGWIRITVDILIMTHLFFAIIIVFNPVAQHLEDTLNIEHVFHWKRVLLRSVMMAVMLFAAETMPHFGAILDLIGGSTVCLLTFVAPSIFYMKLCSMEGDWQKRELRLHERVLHWEFIVIGICGGIASTVSAVMELAGSSTFVPPCYVDASAAQNAQ